MRIVFIGGGNMASAMVGGLLQQGHAAEALFVVEPDADRRAALAKEFGIAALPVDAPLPDSEVVVLAVKPQVLKSVVKAIAPQCQGRLILSIAAGVRLADLDRWLGGNARLVRVMPNTPALVRAGVSGAYLGGLATAADKAATQGILASIGDVVWVETEGQIDAITAISGSGPAYVFLFMEALQAAASQLGFDAVQARSLAYTTFEGAIKLALSSADEVATLRAKVTSKGGTTEAAIATLLAGGVMETMAAATVAAEARAREMADSLGGD